MILIEFQKAFIDGEIRDLKTFIQHNEKILVHQNYLLDFSTKKKADFSTFFFNFSVFNIRNHCNYEHAYLFVDFTDFENINKFVGR